jgi:hypothetical protein
MTEQFQLSPPPDELRTPLVQLKSHYVQQVTEYEKKLALAKDKLAHVEALLDGWSCVEELPLTTELPHPNSPTPTPAAFSAAIPENLSNDEGDVADSDSSLTSSNGHASSAVNNSTLLTHQANGAKSHTSIEEPFSPKLLERFKNTLDTPTRTLLSFCVDSGKIELTDAAVGGKTLSLECPNDAVFRRLKLKLPSLASKWTRFVGEDAIVVVSTATHPHDTKELSWSKEDLARRELVVDKVFEQMGVTYTQLRHLEHSGLVIVPNSLLSGPYGEEKPFVEPSQPPATSNTQINGSHNGSTSSDGGQDVEMLPLYQSMNRIDALSLVLTEHSGTVLHVDFIVRSLYGELEPSLFKVIKNQVGSSLKQGVEQQLWARVVDSPGCYTKDLSLVEPTSPSQVKPSGEGRLSHRKKKSSLFKLSSLMLPPYRGQSLKAVLTSVIESHPGKIYCIDELIALLFGTVEASQKGRVRDAVMKGLSEGKLLGRFESVPDSKGCYTLSVSLLEAQSSTS